MVESEHDGVGYGEGSGNGWRSYRHSSAPHFSSSQLEGNSAGNFSKAGVVPIIACPIRQLSLELGDEFPAEHRLGINLCR
jgi:hypothetical protein